MQTGVTDLVAQLGRMTSMLCEQAGVPRHKLRVGAVGVPAAVHPETADLSLAGNLQGLEGANLRAALAEAMGVDVLIDNDVNLALLAEVGLGSAREFLVNPTGWQGDVLGTLPTRQLFGDINPLRRTPLCVCF